MDLSYLTFVIASGTFFLVVLIGLRLESFINRYEDEREGQQ